MREGLGLMGVIVVDNSALLPLFLHDEDDTYAQVVISQSIAGESLVAPSLCLLEFGNGILKAVRRNRLTPEPKRLSPIASLPNCPLNSLSR